MKCQVCLGETLPLCDAGECAQPHLLRAHLDGEIARSALLAEFLETWKKLAHEKADQLKAALKAADERAAANEQLRVALRRAEQNEINACAEHDEQAALARERAARIADLEADRSDWSRAVETWAERAANAEMAAAEARLERDELRASLKEILDICSLTPAEEWVSTALDLAQAALTTYAAITPEAGGNALHCRWPAEPCAKCEKAGEP